MEWELREVEDTDCTIDDSGVYVVIHRVIEPLNRTETLQGHTVVHKGIVGPVRVRADLMCGDDRTEPITGPKSEAAACIMSFIGSATAVRKALARYLEKYHGIDHPSLEHMSYIGSELMRAELNPHYVQD